jgi:amino acid adenylation domain-containing protein
MQQARHFGKIVLTLPAARTVRPDATYLITGGLGALGLKAASWLADRGARCVVLLGRNAPGTAARDAIAALRTNGCRVEVEAADVGETAEVVRALDRIRRDLPPLRGVIHAAGIRDDGLISDQSQARIDAVWQAKAAGAWALHVLTRSDQLDFFVLYSSVASVLGSAGQTNYAAANACLDGLAEYRRAEGLSALSINWGPWAEAGMAADRGVVAGLARQGIDLLNPGVAQRALGVLLQAGATQATVCAIDWARMSRHVGAAASPVLARLLAPHAPSSRAKELVHELRTTRSGECRAQLVSYVQTELQQVLQLADRPRPDSPIFELGLDSLTTLELRNRLNTDLELDPSLSANALYEHPTITEIAELILESTGKSGHPASPNEPTPVFWSRVTPAPEDRHRPFPLSDIQESYLVGRQPGLEGGGIACHFYIEEEGAGTDIDRLNRAWNRVIERHDMLRAVFSSDGQQRVSDRVPPYAFAICDLCSTDPETRRARLEAIRHEMSHQVLDPERWPLFDIRVTLLPAGRLRLHVSIDLLIADAASLLLLFREWAVFYEQPELAMPALELTFRDCVMAEVALRETEAYDRALAYWLERLTTLPPGPELPLSEQSAGRGDPRFARRAGCLDQERWRKLKDRAASGRLTPSALLCAGYAEVLARWSKHPRFTVILTLFSRPFAHPQLSMIVGDFTSTVLLEVEAGLGSFTEQAQRLQTRLAADLDHSAVSGVRVLRELNRRIAPERRILPVVFTSLLGHQPAHETGDDALALLNDHVYGITQTPQVWLDLQIREHAGRLCFNLDALEDHFPPGMVDDLFDAFCQLLERLAENDTSWTSPLELVPKPQLEARDRLNNTTAPVPNDLLHSLVTKQAAIRPDHMAVVTATHRMTYAELEARARQIGWELRRTGAAPKRLVAVVLEKGWEQVVAVLGIHHAGAAYLPLDPDLPAERLCALLGIGEVEIAITVSRLSNRIAWPDAVRPFCLDELPAPSLREPELPPVQSPTDLAYVIFTSGSTGVPKGVMIDHRGAMNTILDINEKFKIGPEDRVLALSSLTFDLSVFDIFGTLAAGGTIVVPNPNGLRDPSHWLALIEREAITVWNSVPALMRMLTEYLTGRSGARLRSLRLVMLSGDWIPVSLPEQIRALARDAKVISLGGATEASIWSIYYPIDRVDKAWKSIPYGRPLVNQTFHVLSPDFAHCPTWVPGELYIGGVGLALGYWRDPEKTSARFIQSPRTSERLYRTGDWGRFLPDGDIEFLGRDDLQVKVQGYRIELAEVEAALLAYPAVGSCVATAVGERSGDKQLVAYLVPADPRDLAVGHADGASASSEQSLGELIIDPADRVKFRLEERGLLPWNNGRTQVPFSAPSRERLSPELYRTRRSARTFAGEPVRAEALAEWLSNLSQCTVPGRSWPKYRYPSAGGLYPVQSFLYIKPGGVTGLDGGTYYYHPKTHSLLTISTDARLESSVHAPINQQLFDRSAFSLFLVGERRAIDPLYGSLSRDFCLLEAGYMGQLLFMAASSYEIGLCPIGACQDGPVRAALELEDSQILLHSFVGGTACPDAADSAGVMNQAPPVIAVTDEPLSVTNGVHHRSNASSVLRPRNTPDRQQCFIDDVRAFLKGRLPAYMIPTSYVVLESLPLSSNGKVDRQALPAVQRGTVCQGTRPGTPSNHLAHEIAGIVQELAGGCPVSPDDNFFDLGINSLGIVRIHRRICEVARRELEIADVFKYPSIRLLSDFLAEHGGTAPALDENMPRVPIYHGEQAARAATEQSYLNLIRAGKRGRPSLFFLSDFTGDLAGIYPLVGALDAGYSCFGIRPCARPGDDPVRWPEEWLEHYTRSVLEHEPDGPYFFVGYSLGGAFALELAASLTARGGGPLGVALLDSRPTGSVHERVVVRDLPLLRLLQESIDQRSSGLRVLLDVHGNLERAKHRGDLPTGIDLLAMLQQLSAAEKLRPGQYPFPVLLLRAESELPSEVDDEDQAFGWSAHCRGSFDVRLVPGDHSTMLTPPHVRVLTERLEDWLNDVAHGRIATVAAHVSEDAHSEASQRPGAGHETLRSCRNAGVDGPPLSADSIQRRI